ncbi:hypothetical protein [Persephonella sp.]
MFAPWKDREKILALLCELQKSLNYEDKQIITRIFQEGRLPFYQQWFQDNKDEIKRFAEATPSERKKVYYWNIYPERAYLILGAMNLYLMAFEIAKIFDENRWAFYDDKPRVRAVHLFEIYLDCVNLNQKILDPLQYDFCDMYENFHSWDEDYD